MFIPCNEMGVIVRFAQEAPLAGWDLVSIGSTFPDAVICIEGENWNVEFEYAASSFLAHGHDIRQVDMIICWVHDLPDCPIPVVSLDNPLWASMPICRATEQAKEIAYWKQRALRAERKIRVLSALTREQKAAQEVSNFKLAVMERQRKTVEYIQQGKKQDEIAELLGVSIRTVQGDWAEYKKQATATTATNGVSH